MTADRPVACDICGRLISSEPSSNSEPEVYTCSQCDALTAHLNSLRRPSPREYLQQVARAAKEAARLKRPPPDGYSYPPRIAISLVGGMFAAGLTYTVAFTVVAGILLARGASWGSLLLNPDAGRALRLGPMALAELPMDGSRLALLLTALGLLYGLIASVGLPALTTSAWVDLLVTANGLYFGYLATAWLASKAHLLPDYVFSFDLFYIKLCYVMLGYYLITFIPRSISAHSESHLKFEYLLGGGYGLFSGWILSQGSSFEAIVFSGTLLLLVTFVTLFIAEVLVLWLIGFLSELLGQSLWSYFTEERGLPKPLFPFIRRIYTEDRVFFRMSYWTAVLFPVLLVVLFASYRWLG